MEFIFSNAELFSLAGLMQATAIWGLDPAQIAPADPQARQKMAAEGERQLQSRDLLRVNDKNEAALQADVLKAMRAITAPHKALMVIKNTPSLGRQMFALYADADGFYERTQPSADTHRLAWVGGAATRLAEIFPVPATANEPAGYFAMPLESLMALMAQAQTGNLSQAQEAAQNSGSRAGEALMAFARDAAAPLFEGSVSFAPPAASDENMTRDVALVCAEKRVWLITPSETNANAVDVNSTTGEGAMRLWQAALAQI